jgi:hypothetical protein
VNAAALDRHETNLSRVVSSADVVHGEAGRPRSTASKAAGAAEFLQLCLVLVRQPARAGALRLVEEGGGDFSFLLNRTARCRGRVPFGASDVAALASLWDALTGRFWNGAIQNYWNEIAQTASVAHNPTTAENARLFALPSAAPDPRFLGREPPFAPRLR